MKIAMVIMGVLLVMGATGTSDFEIAREMAGQAVENARSLWSLGLQAVGGLALIAFVIPPPSADEVVGEEETRSE